MILPQGLAWKDSVSSAWLDGCVSLGVDVDMDMSGYGMDKGCECSG